MDNSNRKNRISDLLPWLWLMAGAVFMLVYLLGPGKALIDGDMGGEMILSDLLNKEHAFLLSDNWYHATEIHVFFMQIVFRPLLLLFPNNWHTARVIGMLIIYLVNSLGYILMLKEAGCKKLAVWSTGCLLWPIGAWRLNLGVYGGQYLVYDFFAFYIIWLIFRLSKRVGFIFDNNADKRKILGIRTGNDVKSSKIRLLLGMIALGFLSLAGGINGVRETMMLFGPLCAGFLVFAIARYLDNRKEYSSWKDFLVIYNNELNLFLWLIYALFFNVLGYGYNLMVLLKKYSYQSNTTMVWKERFSLNDLLLSISDYFSLFGYSGNHSLFSSAGICSFVGVIIAFIIIAATVRLLFQRNKMSVGQEYLLWVFISGLVLSSLIFGMLEGMNESRYWLPLMFLSFVILQMEADLGEWKLPGLKTLVGVILSGLIVLASLGTIRNEIKSPYEGKFKYLDMAHFLEESGVKQGYAEFWMANTITEQTSGRVVLRPLMYSETFEMMKWSNRIDYATTYPEGEVTLVLDKKSYPGDIYDNCMYKYADPVILKDDDNWLVMTFDSAEKMALAYETALDNGEVMSQEMKIANKSE